MILDPEIYQFISAYSGRTWSRAGVGWRWNYYRTTVSRRPRTIYQARGWGP